MKQRVDLLPMLCWLLPLLSWLAIALSGLLLARPPAPTGDEFLDAAVTRLRWPSGHALVSKLFNPPQYFWAYTNSTAWGKAPARLADLEPQFGTDSHYWELRFVLSDGPAPPDLAADMTERGYPAALWPLMEARRRDLLSGAGLYTLANRFDSARVRAAEAALKKAGTIPDRYTAQGLLPETQERLHLIRTAADEKSGLELESLLDELRTRLPGEALPYYFQAGVEQQRGHTAAALALLAQGNAQPSYAMPRLFPATLAGPADRPPALLGDEFTTAAFLRGSSSAGWRNMPDAEFDTLAADCLARRDSQGLTTLHRFVCRLHDPAGGANGLRSTGYKKLQRLSQLVRTQWPGGLNAAQSAALDKLDSDLQTYAAALASWTAQRQATMSAYRPAFQFRLKLLLSGGLSEQLHASEQRMAQARLDAESALALTPLWQAVAAFDYEALGSMH